MAAGAPNVPFPDTGRPFAPAADNSNVLLVAASPNDAIADTHWFRAEFDAHIVERAVADGVPYFARYCCSSWW